MLPTDFPWYLAPCAWAQSSITNKSCSLASAIIGAISQGQPAKWTQTIATVLSVITVRMVSASIFWLSGLISANTGVKPAVTIELAEAIKVREVTITSPPLGKSKLAKAKSNANVPLATATAYWQSLNAANSFSNSRPSVPVQ